MNLLQGTPDAAALRHVLDTVFAAPAYRWAEDPGPVRALRDWWRELGDWLETLRLDNPAFFRILVALLLLGLILVLGHAAWVLWRTVIAGGGTLDQRAAAPREVRDAEWYYREADRAAVEGRWRDGLQLRFVGLALALDAQGLLRYHPSKTPAECVRDAALTGTDRERLRDLVRALYAHGFGSRPCGPDEYQRWRETGNLSWHASGH